MSVSIEERAALAASASEDDIKILLHDPSPVVIRMLLTNRRLTEEDALVLATRKNLPGDILESIAKDRRFAESYPVKVALSKNPKTPLFSALSIVRYLRFLDQVELTRSTNLPLIFRHKVEAIVMEQIPTMPVGMKKTLARIASGNILFRLIRDGYPEVVSSGLENPHLTEARLYKIISRKETGGNTIRQIAEHPNWSLRYYIRYALIRNPHTPLARSVLFLEGIKNRDLQELLADPVLPVGTRPCIYRELVNRGIDTERPVDEERVYEVDEADACCEVPEFGPEETDDSSAE